MHQIHHSLTRQSVVQPAAWFIIRQVHDKSNLVELGRNLHGGQWTKIPVNRQSTSPTACSESQSLTSSLSHTPPPQILGSQLTTSTG